jgi:sugar transferase EpsL
VKRCTDILVASVLLVLFSPILLCLAILTLAFNGWPIVFSQTRPGLHGKLFTLYKLRSMKTEEGLDGDRLTPFGKLLRKTSLDELPQLWNVLRGDMSLIGPRPLLVQYLPLYTQRQAKRHDVQPGITGWSQVNGRNEPCWEDRLERDVWYVENQSFALDCRIILKTFVKLFSSAGVSAEGQATVEPFKGSPEK